MALRQGLQVLGWTVELDRCRDLGCCRFLRRFGPSPTSVPRTSPRLRMSVPAAGGRAEERRKGIPGTAANYVAITISRCPCRAVRGRA
jgi:hypothetical protein